MNRIVLLGRMTKDPEVRLTQSGKTTASFCLAVDRPFTRDGNKETDFINIVAWNKIAELVGNNVSKGQRLLVEGRLQIRQYKDQTGQNHYITEVVADRVEFIEPKDRAPQNAGGFEKMGEEVPMKFDEDIPF